MDAVTGTNYYNVYLVTPWIKLQVQIIIMCT
jgi:hypothetical protein